MTSVNPPPTRKPGLTAPDRFVPFGALWRDERGFVLVFFALALPVLIGLVGLAIDGSRLFSRDTRLAALADAAARAAATELDRSDNAIANARRAAASLGAGASGDGDNPLQIRFAARREDLRQDFGYTLADGAGARARFVEVTARASSLTAGFLQAVGIAVPALRRSAVAESLYRACDVTPLLMCHRDPSRFFDGASRGRQYLLRYGAGGRADGTLVFLDGTGLSNDRQALLGVASDAPALCYADGVAVRPVASLLDLEDAINIRFDRYVDQRGPIARDLAVFPPAPNVIGGRRLESCSADPRGGEIDPPYHLPRDAAFRMIRGPVEFDVGRGDWTVSAPYGGSGLPPSRTALGEYIQWNHAEKSPVFQGALTASASRYDLYLRELGLFEARQSVPVLTRNSLDSLSTMPTGGPRASPYDLRVESPAPRCYAGPRATTDARRRVLYVAVADCNAALDPGTLSLSVAKFFLTEPADGGLVLPEFVRRVMPGSLDGKLRHIVRLVDTE